MPSFAGHFEDQTVGKPEGGLAAIVLERGGDDVLVLR